MTAVDSANALTRRWVQDLTSEANHVVSGAGAWVVLASALAGADSRARAELEAVLATTRDDAAPGAQQLAGALSRQGLAALLALWTAPEIAVASAFVQALGDGVATGGAPTQAEADAWVTEGTDGLLAECPITIDADTLLLLLGIVTAQGTWQRRFDPAGIPWRGEHREALRRVDPDTSAVDLLDAGDNPDDATAVSRVRCTTTEGFEVHLLGGPASMSVGDVLARGIDAVSTGGRAVDTVPVGASAGMVRVERVTAATPQEGTATITLPVFTVREHHDLLERAALFGLGAASDAREGHFPLISAVVPLYVQAAAQDAVAEFSAEGFRAAAATAIGMARSAAVAPTAPIVRVVAEHDRPFGFLVVEPDAGLVAFAGWVADPGGAAAR